MATKTKTTKTKIKDSLKNVFINELKDKKETERLERVKVNSNLKEFTIYTDKGNKQAEGILDFLTSEGINFIKKERSENHEEWLLVGATTSLNIVPTFYVNGEYLINGRDFQNGQHCLNALKYLGDPNFINPSYKDKLLEHSKTNQYNLYQRLNQLEQKLNPLVQFIQNLQKELQEEEKSE